METYLIVLGLGMLTGVIIVGLVFLMDVYTDKAIQKQVDSYRENYVRGIKNEL